MIYQGKINRQSINFVVPSANKNNCSNGGGALELPYRIRLFSCAKKRTGCRDPVLFSFLK